MDIYRKILLLGLLSISVSASLAVETLDSDRESFVPVEWAATGTALYDGLAGGAVWREDSLMTVPFGYYSPPGAEGETPYAIMGETWTFDHGAEDPYEGWDLRELTYDAGDGLFWRRITDAIWNDNHGNEVSAPLVNTTGCAWVGAYENEADALCWAAGLGYGNNWGQRFVSPTLHYNGTGNLSLSFDLWCDTEASYDFVRVYLQLGSGSEELIEQFDGALNAPGEGATWFGSILQSMFAGETEFRLVFALETDSGWSDEDGDFTTEYGAFAFDNLSLTGNFSEDPLQCNFDEDDHGFVATVRRLVTLYEIQSVEYYEDPCVDLSGNVLALHDTSDAYPHIDGQYTRALSPIVDLTQLPPADTISIRAVWDTYTLLPLDEAVFYQPGWMYYPADTCVATGGYTWSARVGPSFLYYNDAPYCGTNMLPQGDYIPDGAQKIRFVYDVMKNCSLYGAPPWCPDSSNTTPLLDNIRVEVIGDFEFPVTACCVPPVGECYVIPEYECTLMGGTWDLGAVCSPTPCIVPIEPRIDVGGIANAEDWHDWISDVDGPMWIQARIPDHVGAISRVRFYYSTDGGSSWEFIAEDTDGYEPVLNTVDATVEKIGCGWSAEFELPDGTVAGPVHFRSVAYPAEGDSVTIETIADYDPAPASMGAASLEEFVVIDHNALGIEIAANGTEIDRVIIHLQEMIPDFSKGIPGISQQEHSTSHCAPTAAAQCLKYFEGTGDAQITDNLSNFRLVGALSAYMSTNQTVTGTLPSAWVGGLSEWIGDYGEGYSVGYYVHYTCVDGCSNWTAEDWLRIRNELHMCHDVLVGVFWDGGGGHALTLDSIVYPALPDGWVLVGFKDPWTGETATGEIDPATGYIRNLGGAGNGGGGEIGLTMIVTPAESEVAGGVPGDVVYDEPGAPPDTVWVTLPEHGHYIVHITIVNTSGNAHRISRVVHYADPASDVEDDANRPLAFYLKPASPNPLQDRTEILYAVPRSEKVHLTIHDVTGRRVSTLLDGVVAVGVHRVAWDGRDERGRPVGAGIYFVRMKSPSFETTRKITVVR